VDDNRADKGSADGRADKGSADEHSTGEATPNVGAGDKVDAGRADGNGAVDANAATQLTPTPRKKTLGTTAAWTVVSWVLAYHQHAISG
jgi:hypothetical protein